LASTVGETDDREAGDSVANVHLHVDAARLEADDRMRDRACKHPASVGPKPSHRIAAFVEIGWRRGRRARAEPSDPGPRAARRRRMTCAITRTYRCVTRCPRRMRLTATRASIRTAARC